MSNKPTVYMMCGLTGSGKTTCAKRLEREHSAVRFSIDEWMIELYGHHMPREVFDERLETLKNLLWSTARRLLALDINVVLDFGFWKRREWLDFEARAQEVRAKPLFYFFDVPLPTLQKRLTLRNSSLSKGTYEITPEMLTLFAGWFEPPTELEELELVHLGPENEVNEENV